MNNSFVLDRIKSQMQQSIKVDAKVEIEVKKEIEEIKETPISPEELKNELLKELTPPVTSSSEVKEFNGVEDFIVWYLPLKEKFTPNQIIPLMTLVQVNQMINTGCACKRNQRLTQANEYFRVFWTKNAETDLPAKVLEIGNFKKIIFSIPEVKEFLVYPQ